MNRLLSFKMLAVLLLDSFSDVMSSFEFLLPLFFFDFFNFVVFTIFLSDFSFGGSVLLNVKFILLMLFIYFVPWPEVSCSTEIPSLTFLEPFRPAFFLDFLLMLIFELFSVFCALTKLSLLFFSDLLQYIASLKVEFLESCWSIFLF